MQANHGNLRHDASPFGSSPEAHAPRKPQPPPPPIPRVDSTGCGYGNPGRGCNGHIGVGRDPRDLVLPLRVGAWGTTTCITVTIGRHRVASASESRGMSEFAVSYYHIFFWLDPLGMHLSHICLPIPSSWRNGPNVEVARPSTHPPLRYPPPYTKHDRTPMWCAKRTRIIGEHGERLVENWISSHRVA